MERIYYHFPSNIDFERDYGYNADMRYLVKVMASLHGKTGSMNFETQGPDVRTHVESVRARREVSVEIAERRVDFITLAPQNLQNILQTIQPTGSADFRIKVAYSYVDRHYDMMSLKSDTFLIRATVDNGLNLKIAFLDGQARTIPEEIANTIETQLKNFKG